MPVVMTIKGHFNHKNLREVSCHFQNVQSVRNHWTFNIMDNVFFAASPFCRIMCAIGFFPLSLNGPIANGDFVINRRGVIASCCNAVISFIFIVLNFTNSFEFKGVSPFLNVLFRMQAVLGSLLNFMQFFYQIYKRRQIVEILAALNSFDKKVYIDFWKL